jgi:16S rRNA (adenine1518-N6/adenine1519-N6)-dimethyltransferase
MCALSVEFKGTPKKGIFPVILDRMLTLKKSLGQHFLKDEGMCQRIVSALQEDSFSRLLEVGPGGGALSRYLIKLPQVDLRLVELDDEKIDFLKQNFPALTERIIRGSILEVDCPFNQPFSLIGNFPYNISSQIVFRIIEWRENIETVIGMFQKEVAQRICSGPGSKEYGILSVLTQAYFEVDYLFDVPPECFTPPPKVMSGVIRMKCKGNPYQIENHDKFLRIVKLAFGQRRKQIRNPLKSIFPKDSLSDPFFNKRAEQLSVLEFVELSKRMA